MVPVDAELGQELGISMPQLSAAVSPKSQLTLPSSGGSPSYLSDVFEKYDDSKLVASMPKRANGSMRKRTGKSVSSGNAARSLPGHMGSNDASSNPGSSTDAAWPKAKAAFATLNGTIGSATQGSGPNAQNFPDPALFRIC